MTLTRVILGTNNRINGVKILDSFFKLIDKTEVLVFFITSYY